MVTYTNFIKHCQNLIRKGWTQHTFARDKNKEPVSVSSPEACSFCLLGAVYKTARDLGPKSVIIEHKLLDSLEALTNQKTAKFNDKKGRTKTQIINLLNSALNSYRKEKYGK